MVAGVALTALMLATLEVMVDVAGDAGPADAVAGMATLKPAAVARKLCGPVGVVASVNTVDARPFASVVALAVPTAPPMGAAKMTSTPATPAPSVALT